MSMPTEAEVVADIQIVLGEVTRTNPAPIQDAIVAALDILRYFAGKNLKLPVPTSTPNLASARAATMPHLAAMQADATPEKIGDGTFLQQWGPVLSGLLIQILQGLLKGGMGGVA